MKMRRIGFMIVSLLLCVAVSSRAEIATSQAPIAPPTPHVMRTEANSPVVKEVRLETQFVVCGGGLSGICAAVSAARRETGRLREVVDVILVGAETVRRDNPSLLSHGRRNDDLFRAVATRSGRLPRASRIFTDAARDRTLVFQVGMGNGERGMGNGCGCSESEGDAPESWRQGISACAVRRRTGTRPCIGERGACR